MGAISVKETPLVSGLAKSPTGITGLDEITFGGLPRGRPTLLCGNAGCGKTLLAMEFLVHGARDFGEPGVFIAFEENELELVTNFHSLGFDLDKLVAQKKILIDYVYVERSEFEETGEYDLEGLFVRIESAISSINAKRIVLDTIEALFSGLSDESILRAELRRLFRWLKDRGMTTIITGERGDHNLTRFGLEEYVADCVILLDHRVNEQIATRRLKILKYRGSIHGTNEYPFLIDKTGISVVPITSLGLDYRVSMERISSGIPGLDELLCGNGYYRGSSVLVSGDAGTGKSSFASFFAASACRRGEKALVIAFEESENQITRNMANIGLDLSMPVKKGLLFFSANRPSTFGLEMHLNYIHKLVSELKPEIVVIDPISNLIRSGNAPDVQAMLARTIDFLKMNRITSLYTDLSAAPDSTGAETGVSSLMDTWISLQNAIEAGQRNRYASIIKSRGTRHSNNIRSFTITDSGIVFAGAPAARKGE